MPEAAAEAADELRREAQQHLGERAAGHQLGGQDEERHGHQREDVDAAEQVLRERNERQPAVHEDRRERGAAQRERDRHAECEQRDTGGEERGDHSFTASASNSASAR